MITLSALEVSSLATTLTYWECAEYFFAGLVTLACFGEYVATFTNWFTDGIEAQKRRLEQYSTVVLVGALALELVCLVRTNSLSGRLIGSLSDESQAAVDNANRALIDSNEAVKRSGAAQNIATTAVNTSDVARGAASNALVLAEGARREADSFEKDIAFAKKQATSAESHLAEALREAAAARRELIELKTPRTLSPAQQAEMVRALKSFVGTTFDLSTASDEESVKFVYTIKSILSSAGWKQVDPRSRFIGIAGSKPMIAAGVVTTGVMIQIDAARASAWLKAADTLTGLLKANGIIAKGEVVLSGVDPNAVHIEIGPKPR